LSCQACHRKAGERDFCPLHLKAYENIVKKYDFWRKALRISWKEYISEIEENSLTVEWAREVAKYLLNNEETRNVTES
jgi:predicted metal-binding protein